MPTVTQKTATATAYVSVIQPTRDNGTLLLGLYPLLKEITYVDATKNKLAIGTATISVSATSSATVTKYRNRRVFFIT